MPILKLTVTLALLRNQPSMSVLMNRTKICLVIHEEGRLELNIPAVGTGEGKERYPGLWGGEGTLPPTKQLPSRGGGGESTPLSL